MELRPSFSWILHVGFQCVLNSRGLWPCLLSWMTSLSRRPAWNALTVGLDFTQDLPCTEFSRLAEIAVGSCCSDGLESLLTPVSELHASPSSNPFFSFSYTLLLYFTGHVAFSSHSDYCSDSWLLSLRSVLFSALDQSSTAHAQLRDVPCV